MTSHSDSAPPLLLAGRRALARRRSIVLHAARVLDVESGKMLQPGEVLVTGERIVRSRRDGHAIRPAPKSSIWATAPCCRA